ncbi:MAG: maleylpyruvate isomerase family mycothiol-dependent enzyme [Jatrophihabitans sp.]
MPTPLELSETITWMADGEDAFAAAAAGLDDAAVTGPSRLPGWTRGHVLSHLARNADALGNLLDWGRTGVEHRMYPDRVARNADIDGGAGRDAATQRADLDSSRKRLATAVADFPAERWTYLVRGATGRELPVADVPWLRTREVWLHLVDLDAGADLSVLPTGAAERLCAENLRGFADRHDAPAAQVVLLPGGTETVLGSGDGPTVLGAASALVGWLTGRDPGDLRTTDGAAPPTLPSWL